MNPLTQIKNTQKITKKEIELGLFEKASWHARFAHSAYIFTGGLDYELTEGDLLAVFAQYGEIVDVNLVRDKSSGKSKGFAFLAYEDQRSTVLAVDNLSASTVAGRKIRVEHVENYKKRKAELEGEDLAAVPEEPPLKRHHSDASNGAAAVTADSNGSPPPVVPPSHAAAATGRLADAWQAPNSLFSLLAEAKPVVPAVEKGAHRERKEHKKHKHKKEKRSKQDKSRHSRSRSRSHSHSHSPSPTPMKSHGQSSTQQQQPHPSSGPSGSFGPPRPPAGTKQDDQQQQQQQQRNHEQLGRQQDEHSRGNGNRNGTADRHTCDDRGRESSSYKSKDARGPWGSDRRDRDRDSGNSNGQYTRSDRHDPSEQDNRRHASDWHQGRRATHDRYGDHKDVGNRGDSRGSR